MVQLLVQNDPTFFRDTVANIQIDSMDDVPIYYFDGFNPSGTTHQPIYYSASRSMRHYGIFELQIEDENYTIDTEILGRVSKFKLKIGKTESNMNNYLNGFLRGFGHHAGFKGKVLYNIFGYGWLQRANERIVDYNKGPPTLLTNSLEIDQTDDDYFANAHMENLFEDHNVYPPDTKQGWEEGNNAFEFVKADGMDGPTGRSTETAFIPSIVIRFGTIADVIALIEQYTGARAFVDFSQNLQFNALLNSPSGNKGFVFKNQKELNIDDSDWTGYLTSGVLDIARDLTLESSFSNHFYGILAAETAPPVDDAASLSGFESNFANEIAVPFRPPTAPNYAIYLAIQMNDGNADSHVPKTRIRICRDANPFGRYPSTIVNAGGIIDSDDFTEQSYDFSDNKVEVMLAYKGNSLVSSTQWYWMIFSSVNATATEFWKWMHNGGSSALRAIAPNGTSTATDGGGAWTYSSAAPQMKMYILRTKAQAQGFHDDKSTRKHFQLIDSQFNLPINVNTVIGSARYLNGLGRYKTRPRPVYQVVIRPPNKPIFEGDVATLIHDDVKLSTVNNGVRSPAIFGNIGEVTYTAGIKNAGAQDPIQLGMKKVALTIVGNPYRY